MITIILSKIFPWLGWEVFAKNFMKNLLNLKDYNITLVHSIKLLNQSFDF